MNGSNEELRKALENWSEITLTNAEVRLKTLTARSILGVAQPTDTYSSWAMGGVAGGLVAILANLHEVAELIGAFEVRLALTLLIISILFGVVQKVVASSVTINLLVENEIERGAKEVFDAHQAEEKKIQELARSNGVEVSTAIDHRRVVAQMAELFPPLVRRYFEGSTQKAETDPSYMHKRLIRACLRQAVYVGLQVVLAVAAVVIVAVSL